MSTKNKQIVEKINDSFAKGNTEGFLENCADNVVWRMIGDKTFTGKNAIREFMASMEGTEPPKFTVDNTIAEGDSVVSYGDMTMTEKGKTTPYSYCDVYRFKGDKIAELTSYVVKTAEQSKQAGTA